MRNVWNIPADTDQDDDAIIETAIVRTETSSRELGLPVSL
jgi:NADP-dependent alcohol dehydrogenase